MTTLLNVDKTFGITSIYNMVHQLEIESQFPNKKEETNKRNIDTFGGYYVSLCWDLTYLLQYLSYITTARLIQECCHN